MALCTSCGSQVDDAASFCTSCGRRMPAASQPSMAVTAAPSVCSACGAQADPGFAFCTNCGQRIAAQALADPAPAASVAEPIAAATAAPPVPVDVTPMPAASSASATPVAAETAAAPTVTVPEEAVTQPAAPQLSPPIYAAPSDYPPAQPAGGAFRIIVLILLLVIVVGAFGGWYFWGVETVIVCSPPDVRVFLDDKELAPASYGRYVVPHLSRQSHLLKVQRPGFADTIQKLDFPLTSTQEWVNIKLVPSGRLRQ